MTDATEEYFAWLRSPAGGSCLACKDLGKGVYCAVKPLIFHWTLIVGYIGDKDAYFDQYCYQDLQLALTGLLQWNGESDPKGWFRNPRTGRRRPDGDEAKEYFAA